MKTNLFPTLADLQAYVPGISSDFRLSELNPSAISAKKQICDIITNDLWGKIAGSDADTEAKTFLRIAYGNLAMYKYVIFDILAKRASGGIEVYKSEQETIRRQYIDNYYNAMDSLIEEMEGSSDLKPDWHNSPGYSGFEQLKIQSTKEFNFYYGIDMSYLFFFRTIPIQRELLDDVIGDYFNRISERKADFEGRLKRALVQLIISLALTRFDIIEFPPTIRSLFDEQKSSRNGADEFARIREQSALLQASAMEILKNIDLALSEPDNGNIETETSFNDPNDKIFLMA